MTTYKPNEDQKSIIFISTILTNVCEETHIKVYKGKGTPFWTHLNNPVYNPYVN